MSTRTFRVALRTIAIYLGAGTTMRAAHPLTRFTLATVAALWGCSSTSNDDDGDGGSTAAAGETGGTASGGAGTSAPSETGGDVTASGGNTASGGAPATGGSPATGGTNTGGRAATGGAPATGGRPATGGSTTAGGAATGGRASTGGAPAGGETGTTEAGSGGAATGGATSASSGNGGTSSAGSTGACTMGGAWPAADPAETGPFATTTESEVGPEAGVTSADDDTPVRFTLFRPKDMTEGGLCHPVITWGDGHGTTPSMYSGLLTRLASHGFVVIASNSANVSKGSPAPMLVGVTWVLEQNADPTSDLYQRIDTTHIGATGHSEGAMATASVGADSNIVTIAPICAASTVRNLHGPALLLCGGQDTTLPCSGSLSALESITTQPALVADYLTATHANWITRGNSAPSPIEVAALAWMRVQLMDDSTLRPMFYGASCTLCTDPAWEITQNSLMPE
ncbi:MAG: hypothetical protein JW940_32630 [Polyangiaceae bacterium]|nr:hypothetical protein [Polyangiaceae bacterium]